mgnify:CR=1 FL=1
MRVIYALKDIGGGGGFPPKWKKGERINAAVIIPHEPPPGFRGFSGWRVKNNTTDITEYFFEEGIDVTRKKP